MKLGKINIKKFSSNQRDENGKQIVTHDYECDQRSKANTYAPFVAPFFWFLRAEKLWCASLKQRMGGEAL